MTHYGYIYRTTNRVNGKVYIGQKRSAVVMLDYLGSGVMIRRAVAKHGAENFQLEVLDFAISKRELDKQEQLQIILHRSLLGRDQVYNITPGGEGCGKGPEHPWFGKKASAETRQRMSAAHSGEKNHMFGVRLVGDRNPMFGKKQSAEARAKIAAKAVGRIPSFKGKPRPAEWSANISAAKKGKPSSLKGKKLSEETCRRISEAAKAKFAAGYKTYYSEETRRKISEGRKRYWAKKKGLL